ncbi:hypothetical protein ACFL6C_00665 [Myxococcota bacterium]
MKSVVLLFVLVTGPDAVPPADPDVRAAINRYDVMEYGDVVARLRRALARPELSQADERAALAYLGRTFAVLRKPRKATDAFVELLRLDPEFDVEAGESPLIREALARAEKRVGRASPKPSGDPTTGHPPAIGAEVSGSKQPGLVAETGGLEAPRPDPLRPLESDTGGDGESLFSGPMPYIVAGGAVVAATIVAVIVVAPWQEEPEPGTLGLWWLP